MQLDCADCFFTRCMQLRKRALQNAAICLRLAYLLSFGEHCQPGLGEVLLLFLDLTCSTRQLGSKRLKSAVQVQQVPLQGILPVVESYSLFLAKTHITFLYLQLHFVLLYASGELEQSLEDWAGGPKAQQAHLKK